MTGRIIAALIAAATDVLWAVILLAKLRRESITARDLITAQARQQATGDGATVSIPARELAMYKRLADAVCGIWANDTGPWQAVGTTDVLGERLRELRAAHATLHQYQQERQAR